MIPSARVRTSARIKAVIKNQEGSVLLDQRFTNNESLFEKLRVYLKFLGSIDGNELRNVVVRVTVTLSQNSQSESGEQESLKPLYESTPAPDPEK